MAGFHFTKGGNSCASSKIIRFFYELKIHRVWIAVFVMSILSAHVARAQDPVVSALEPAVLSYDEGQTPTPISTSITVSDPDSPLLASANVQITGNHSSTEDQLQFTDAFSITGSFDTSIGTLTLTGPASPADFTSALRTITYLNTNNGNPSNLVRTVSFSVNDGTANSVTVTRDIQVNRVNDAPIGQTDHFVMYEDTDLDCGCLLHNDTDADGDNLIALYGQPPAHGTVYDLGGVFIYTPHPNYYGTDSFTYYANDGTENSNETLVTITILPVNDAPIALNDAIATDEDTPIGIPVLSNDIDVDDVLVPSMIVLLSSPAQGSLAINNTTGAVVYTPNLNFNGNDSFTYQVKDASGALSNIATVNITINPVNDAPVANADLATTPEEVAVSIPVLANDTDVDNPLSTAVVIIVNSPAHGTAVVESATGAILYTPQKDFTGNDSFTYQVRDSQGANSAAAEVAINVTLVNDRPVAVNDQATTDENTSVDINILINDYDVDGAVIPASVVITTIPVHGTITVNTVTGLVTFVPQTDFEGNDSFAYTIQDIDGLISLPATVSVSVIAAPNRPPVAVDDAPIVNTGLSPVTIDVLANDYDDDNNQDELSIISVTNPSIGTVSIVDGKIVYQPAGLISATVTFTYTIQDPEGLTDEAIVTIENSFLPLVVSEGFSPNSDNNNETWYIQGIEYYPNNTVKIFDRWGFLVYQKQHYENSTAPWDGRGNAAQHAGKLLDQGTYYYILEPGDEMKTMNGYVVIVR